MSPAPARTEARPRRTREDVIAAALAVAQARTYIEAHPEDGTAPWSLEAAEDFLDDALRRHRLPERRERVRFAPAPPSLTEVTREACRREREAQEKAARDARTRLLVDRLRDAARRVPDEWTPRPRPSRFIREALCGIPECYCDGYAHP